MPPAKSQPVRKKAVATAGQPPSSLATPPVPLPPSQRPHTRSQVSQPSSRTASPTRASSPSPDDAPTFVHPPPASPPIHTRSPSPTSSEFPTSSLDQLDDNQEYAQNQPATYGLVLPEQYYAPSQPYLAAPPPVPRLRPALFTPFASLPSAIPQQTRPASVPNLQQQPRRATGSNQPHIAPQATHLAPQAIHPYFYFPPSVPAMSHNTPTGPAAMPSKRSNRAPTFSGSDSESLPDFLHDYEALADSCGLTDAQKVECILRYIPRSLQSLWKTLPGFQNVDWDDLKAHLVTLYPDIAASSRDTKQGLKTFIDLSAAAQICSEADVQNYYRNFLTVASPLLDSSRITLDDYNTAFFKGFPPKIQDIIAKRLEVVFPHHPVHEPFAVEGVLNAARRYFSSNQFYRAKSKKKSDRSKHYDSPDAFIQRVYGSTRPHKRRATNSNSEPDSDSDHSADADSDSGENTDSSLEFESKKAYNKKSSRSRGRDDNDPMALITKLQSLSIHEPSYLVLYSQCQKRFLEIAQNLPKPQLLPASTSQATISYQSNHTAAPSPQAQASPQHHSPVSAPVHTSAPTASDSASDFFRT